MKKIEIPRNRLKNLYLDKRLSTYEIAKIFECDPTVIQNRLREYNVKIRYPKKRIDIDKKYLRELYLNKKLSTYKIANIFNCGARTVYSKLIENGIKTRPIKRIMISKKKLFDLYHHQKLSYSQIANKYSCSPSIIFDMMKKYKIIPRDASESNTIYPKFTFSGDLIEKAYLIGFRLGDLNVTKKHYLIYVKSNTTKNAQVKLMKQIYSKYGYLRIKKYQKGVFNMECSLNGSFNFLIPKIDFIEDWIVKEDNYFAAFLAGYMDAEGNIGVYSNRARVRIGSCDKGILDQIHYKLNELKIQNTYRLEMPATIGRYNKDFLRVNISKKEDILKLFKLVKPYLKHQKRWEDLKKAEKNIRIRS
tara:strand:+ start:270 stop:1352 length:1083 start_codon:yes stop_codon:yes gene_type:complete